MCAPLFMWFVPYRAIAQFGGMGDNNSIRTQPARIRSAAQTASA